MKDFKRINTLRILNYTLLILRIAHLFWKFVVGI